MSDTDVTAYYKKSAIWFMAFVLLALICASINPVKTILEYRGYVRETAGIVENVETNRVRRKNGYKTYCKITYSYFVNGETYRFDTDWGKRYGASTGMTITVRFDPDYPERHMTGLAADGAVGELRSNAFMFIAALAVILYAGHSTKRIASASKKPGKGDRRYGSG